MDLFATYGSLEPEVVMENSLWTVNQVNMAQFTASDSMPAALKERNAYNKQAIRMNREYSWTLIERQ